MIEHAGVERDRLRDLDDLLVGDREARGRAVGVDAHAESLEERRSTSRRIALRSMRPKRPHAAGGP